MAPLTVRRNAYSMSSTDWSRFVTAVKKLKTNGTYDAWTRRHHQASTAHRIDTSSGVESAPGVKDVALIEAFFRAVRAAGKKIAA